MIYAQILANNFVREQVTSHDLRHTAITYMLEAGENPKTVSEFAGHATAQFTMNQYAHVLDQSKKKASDALMNTLFLK